MDTSCIDWAQRLVERRSLVPPPIYEDEAEAALAVFKSLKMVDAPKVWDGGKLRFQTFGETCDEWVFDLVRAIFGAADSDNGRRQIREAFLLISKKNGKSTLAAGIMVTALIRNWRHEQELLILAPTMEVADNAFGPARAMVENDENLMVLLHVQVHLSQITHRVTKAVLKVVAADSGTVSGSKAGFVLVDELWMFGMKHDADAMFREATGGLSARPEGFIIWLSTQSDREPAGVFKTKLQYFRDVRDGIIDDPESLPILYEFPESMIANKAYLDPEWFYITNPHMGRSVSAEWIAAELKKVINATGSELQVFLAKHLNVEIGMRLSHDRWRGADYWEAAAEPGLTLPDLLARCEVAVIGIDGGGLDDLLGLCVMGREKETRRWLVWTQAICSRDVLLIRQDIASRLEDFEKAGDVKFLEEFDAMDCLGEIVDQVEAAGLLPAKHAVAVDPNNASDIFEMLGKRGIVEPKLFRVLQGRRLTPAINRLPGKLKHKTLLHSGSPMMNWCVSNAKCVRSGNDMLVTKQVSGSAKIDPVIALLNATIVMSFNPVAEPKPESVYEKMARDRAVAKAAAQQQAA